MTFLIDNLSLAEIGPGEVFLFIPIVALCIPIIKMLVQHQQRMAEIIHGTANEHSHAEIAQLRHEVYELKQLVHQQMIALDSHSSMTRVPVETPLQRRLEEA